MPNPNGKTADAEPECERCPILAFLTFGCVLSFLATLGLLYFSMHQVSLTFDRPVFGAVRAHYTPVSGALFGARNTFTFGRQMFAVIENSDHLTVKVPRLCRRVRFAFQFDLADANVERIDIAGRLYTANALQLVENAGYGQRFYQKSPYGGQENTDGQTVRVYDLAEDIGLSLWWVLVCWGACFVLAGVYTAGLIKRDGIGTFLSRYQPVVCVLSMATSFAYILIRFSERLSCPQFWGEDGQIFYKQAYDSGLLSLSFPHAGYLHSYQRVVALLSQGVDILIAPQFFNAFALLAQLCFYLVVWCRTNRLGISGKILMTLAPFLIPTGGDVLLNLTNSMWILSLGLVLVMLSNTPRTTGQWGLHLVYILIAGLTGPFSIIFSPLFLIRFLLLRKDLPKKETWRVAWYLVIASVNFAALTSGERYYPEVCPNFWEWMELFKNLALPYFLGVIDHFRHPGGVWTLVLSILLSVALLPLCFLGTTNRRELLDRAVLACCGLSILASALWQWRDRPHIFLPYFGFDRYCFVIYGCLSCLLIYAIVARGQKKWQTICQAAAAAILLASMFYSVMNSGQKLPWKDYGYPAQVEEFRKTGRQHFTNPPDWEYDLVRH